jgi:hypothetical protein
VCVCVCVCECNINMLDVESLLENKNAYKHPTAAA